MEPVSWFPSDQKEWQGNVSKRDGSHATTRQTNPRTERQDIQQGKLSELSRN
jgi:hypothetical protein